MGCIRAVVTIGALAAAMVALPVMAQPRRSPQVEVSGNSLQTVLTFIGQAIDVHKDQLDVQRWSATAGSTIEFRPILGLGAADAHAGIYNAAVDAPFVQLYMISIPVQFAGWYAVISVGASPSRFIVNWFDRQDSPRGMSTIYGVDLGNFAFYLQVHGVALFGQDARNPGGTPHLLVFAGTGARAGGWWLCWEEAPYGGDAAQNNYDDVVVFVSSLAVTPARATSWGEIKTRFR